MEMQDRISQLSLATFMAEFVPGPDVPSGVTIEAFNPLSFECEGKEMYDEVCKVANSVLASVPAKEGVPRFTAKSSYCWSDLGDKHDIHSRGCTDVAFYPDREWSTNPYAIEPKTLKRKSEQGKEDQMETEARMSWLWASLILQAKSNKNDSPFVVPKPEVQTESEPVPQASKSSKSNALPVSPTVPVEPSPTPVPVASTAPHPAGMASSADAHSPFLRLNTKGGRHTMAQMVEYVSRVLEKQFILFFFTVFICRHHAWLLRWDRAGLVVSEPFNFIEDPYLLHCFIYRFACLDDAQRGRDITVKPASQEELRLVHSFRGKLTDWQQARFNEAFKSKHPVYRIEVPQADMISAADLKAGKKVPREKSNSSDEQKRLFLVGRPYFTYGSVIGRGTRRHIAYDVSDGRVVFCKEYWRLDVPSHHPEGETLLELHSKGVQYIATPLVAGVVRSGDKIHCTRSQTFRQRPGAKYIQYRIIVIEVGEPLKNYTSSLELLGVMFQAMTAHEQAWTRCHILHRDISAHNILIYRYFDRAGVLVHKALLVDWGLCKLLEELERMASQDTRSGTWPFISAVLLAYPGRFKYEVWHDLESFVHVLHWMCLRFQKTNFTDSPTLLGVCIDQLYEAHVRADGKSLGGRNKLKFLSAGIVPFNLQGGSSIDPANTIGLHNLLLALAGLYGEHYKLLKPILDEMEAPASLNDVVLKQKRSYYEGPGMRIPDRVKCLFPKASASHPRVAATPNELASRQEPDMSASPFNHEAVLAAFYMALEFDERPWADDPKQSDQFEKVETSWMFECFRLRRRVRDKARTFELSALH